MTLLNTIQWLPVRALLLISIFTLFFTSLLSASRNVCGESITDKAWTEAPRLLSHLYIWGVMINISSIEYFSVCLNLFLLFKNSIINKYGLVHYKVLIIFNDRS